MVGRARVHEQAAIAREFNVAGVVGHAQARHAVVAGQEVAPPSQRVAPQTFLMSQHGRLRQFIHVAGHGEPLRIAAGLQCCVSAQRNLRTGTELGQGHGCPPSTRGSLGNEMRGGLT